MIYTPLGFFFIKEKENIFNYEYTEISNRFRLFEVEKRFDIFLGDKTDISFGIESETLKSSLDSDENLLIKQFESNDYLIAIGINSSYPKIEYEDFKDKIIIKKCKSDFLKMRLVWCKKTQKGYELGCWYGADPEYD